jgi:hypothetical protein
MSALDGGRKLLTAGLDTAIHVWTFSESSGQPAEMFLSQTLHLPNWCVGARLLAEKKTEKGSENNRYYLYPSVAISTACVTCFAAYSQASRQLRRAILLPAPSTQST